MTNTTASIKPDNLLLMTQSSLKFLPCIQQDTINAILSPSKIHVNCFTGGSRSLNSVLRIQDMCLNLIYISNQESEVLLNLPISHSLSSVNIVESLIQ
jgi:hypothetical protein